MEEVGIPIVCFSETRPGNNALVATKTTLELEMPMITATVLLLKSTSMLLAVLVLAPIFPLIGLMWFVSCLDQSQKSTAATKQAKAKTDGIALPGQDSSSWIRAMEDFDRF